MSLFSRLRRNSRLFPFPRERPWLGMVTWHPHSECPANKTDVEDVLKIDSCSYFALCSEENVMFSSSLIILFVTT